MAKLVWMLRAGLLAFLCVNYVSGQDSFRLANIYSDEMVLQMAPKSTKIWGFGLIGASVSVVLDSQQPIETTVSGDGTWSVRLTLQPPGGPFQLKASQSDGSSVTINVWFGDVWVCSGQSNMEMPISQMVDAAGETAKALTFQNLRLFRVANTMSDTEQEELIKIDSNWASPNNQNVPGFSALCLMYGERLSEALGNSRPIGLIDSSWGGTRIEAWSSQRNLQFCETPANNKPNDKNSDTVLWNAMIKPLTNMAVRGAIWYQGEANAGYHAAYYSCHMIRLIEDWTSTFVDGTVPVPEENTFTFPFGIAQIGPNSGGGPSNYGYLRWHQSADFGYAPNTAMREAFMAATYDTTDPDSPTGNIHPRDKMTVADRLANAAKNILYGQDYAVGGPNPIGKSINSPGNVSIFYFTHIKVQGTQGFTAKLPDGTWVNATITGAISTQVDVTFDPTATHLAYAWQGVVCDYKACSIYSDDDDNLPANVWIWDLSE